MLAPGRGEMVILRNGSQVGGGPSPRTPVGGCRQQHQRPNPNAPAPRNSPTTINGRDYSGHAIDRMQERGYVTSVVENAIRVGASTPGTTVFTDAVNQLRVMVNSDTGRVVTIIPGVRWYTVPELYEVVREAVHARWDPIGIGKSAPELGEYDSSVPGLCNLSVSQPSEEEVFRYLWTVETESLGLRGHRETTGQFPKWLRG